MINQKNAADVFKVLSDPTRLRIMRLLVVNKTEICVCEFVDSMEEQQYNVSKHIKLLESSGLIERRKESRWIYYSTTKEKDPIAAALFKIIASLPDSEKQFITDQKRFDSRMKLREAGRCQIGIQNAKLSS